MTNDNQASWATLILKATSADRSVVKHTLSTAKNNVIGRSPDCQIPLNPHEFITVSRRHAEIKLVNANWQINDLGTTNGTLVNDCQIDSPQQLESGDRITLGATGPEFTFECLTLNATVMVQSTEIKADILEPAKSEATTKSEAQSVAIPKDIAEAGIVFFASQEPQAVPELSQPSVVKPQAVSESSTTPVVEPQAVPELSQPSVVKPQAVSESSATPIVEPQPKQESVAELKPEAIEEMTANAVVTNATISEVKTAQPVAKSNKISVSSPVKVFNSGKTLWNLVSTTELCQMSGHSQLVLGLAFSPDGQTFASAAKDNTIKLWNIASQAEIATLTGHQLAPNTVVFSPDGQTLASGGADKTIKLWKLDNQEEIASFVGHKLAINALAFSPDGQTLSSGSKDRTIKLWNIASKEEITMIAGHKKEINAIGFSPDGQIIASAGADQTIKLWNKETLTEIAAIATPNWQTGAIAIAADGQTLAGSDEQGTIKLWQI